MDQKIWINGKLAQERKARISPLDRGFLYGDGVYEAVRVYGGKIFRAEEHWKRLDGSLQGIRLKIPWSHSALTGAVLSVVKANGLEDCLVRVTISRGVGKLGYDPASCKKPTVTALASPVRKDLPQLWSRGVQVSIVRVRRNHVHTLNPSIKSINCLNGILAKMESLKHGDFEGVFLNLDGYLAEGTISNIFLFKKRTWLTPHLKCGILNGVTRHAVIEAARRSRIKVLETWIRPSQVLNADEVFLTSTTMEVMPVVKVNGKTIGQGVPGSETKRLHALFREILRREIQLKSGFPHHGEQTPSRE